MTPAMDNLRDGCSGPGDSKGASKRRGNFELFADRAHGAALDFLMPGNIGLAVVGKVQNRRVAFNDNLASTFSMNFIASFKFARASAIVSP